VTEDPIVQVKSYQDLIAWQEAISLVTEVYTITSQFPGHEIYGLTSQLRRASVSIPSNIAEGHGRATPGEFNQFLCQARGSLCEVQTQVVIAQRLAYITQDQEELFLAKTNELGRILSGLITSIQRKKLKPAALALTPSP
jgi:four helix bundle protein